MLYTIAIWLEDEENWLWTIRKEGELLKNGVGFSEDNAKDQVHAALRFVFYPKQ